MTSTLSFVVCSQHLSAQTVLQSQEHIWSISSQHTRGYIKEKAQEALWGSLKKTPDVYKVVILGQEFKERAAHVQYVCLEDWCSTDNSCPTQQHKPRICLVS